MSLKDYRVYRVGAARRLCRVVQVSLFNNPPEPACPRCGEKNFTFVLDIIQHGFWSDDITSIGECSNCHWIAFHAVVPVTTGFRGVVGNE